MANLLKVYDKLTTTQYMILNSLRSFCGSYLKPRVINDYKNEIVDREIFLKMGEMGIFGPTIKGFGCLGENYKILGTSSSWLRYQLPSNLVNVIWGGKYKGQEQLWFACKFYGSDVEVNLNRFSKPEFFKWRWINPSDSVNLAVPFKKELYSLVLDEFSKFLV